MLGLTLVVCQGPTIERINDVTMKACPTVSCAGTSIGFVVGHSDPTYSVSSLIITVAATPLEGLDDSPLSEVRLRAVPNSFGWTITLFANGKNSGETTVVVTAQEDVLNGQTVERLFRVTVVALAPVFDDSGPSRTVVDLRTLVGTPTFPYTFLVGHEDPELSSSLSLTAFSSDATVLPNVCCDSSDAFMAQGGIHIELVPSTRTFVVGQIVINAWEVVISIRPDPTNFGELTLTLRLSDGNQSPTLSPIKVTVYDRPKMESFCSYDVLVQDNLQSIADLYGMHWMTLFFLNNHTLDHPDNLVPGSRLSIGRAYVVKKGDSLYSIAKQYGTSWQHIKAMNPAAVLDEKNLFEGQLLCLSPDLAFVACRHRQ